MHSPASAPPRDYVSLVVCDNTHSRVDLVRNLSDGLNAKSPVIRIADAVLAEIRSGCIEGVKHNPQGQGETMIIFEDDTEGGVTMEVVVSPQFDLTLGEASPAQALALSALRRVELRWGHDLFDPTGADYGRS
jgi:hypothetical protein